MGVERESRGRKKKAVFLPGSCLFPLCPKPPTPSTASPSTYKQQQKKTHTKQHTYTPVSLQPRRQGAIKHTHKTVELHLHKRASGFVFKVLNNAGCIVRTLYTHGSEALLPTTQD